MTPCGNNPPRQLGELIVEGYACTTHFIPNRAEVFMHGCFDAFLKTAPTVPLLYDHDPDDLIGYFTQLEQREDGLWAVATVTDHRVKNRWPEFVNFSMRPLIQKATWFGGTRYVSQALLMEISLVFTPANPRCIATLKEYEYETH